MQNIPLFKIYSDMDDVRAATNIIKRGTYWASSSEITEFEKKLADYLQIKYAVCFNSGTSALHSVLMAYGINSGEVIVPSFTFIATSNVVILAGAKPIFAESEHETYGLDVESVKEKISKKTEAIIPLHYGGLPSRDIVALKELAEDNNILLIEDAAEALGSKIDENMIGSHGDAAMFSFCQNKIITTGEGGAAVTNSKKIYEKLKIIRSHGRVEKQNDYFSTMEEMDYVDVGYNFRMPAISAAIGISQIKKIDKIIGMRRKNAHYLTKKLSKIKDIKTPLEPKKQSHVYQLYTIQLENKKQRNKLQHYLNKKGIMTKVYFNPIHLKTYYKNTFGYKKGCLPGTEELSQKVLTLPMYPHLSKQSLDYMVKNIKAFFQEV